MIPINLVSKLVRSRSQIALATKAFGTSSLWKQTQAGGKGGDDCQRDGGKKHHQSCGPRSSEEQEHLEKTKQGEKSPSGPKEEHKTPHEMTSGSGGSSNEKSVGQNLKSKGCGCPAYATQISQEQTDSQKNKPCTEKEVQKSPKDKIEPDQRACDRNKPKSPREGSKCGSQEKHDPCRKKDVSCPKENKCPGDETQKRSNYCGPNLTSYDDENKRGRDCCPGKEEKNNPCGPAGTSTRSYSDHACKSKDPCGKKKQDPCGPKPASDRHCHDRESECENPCRRGKSSSKQIGDCKEKSDPCGCQNKENSCPDESGSVNSKQFKANPCKKSRKNDCHEENVCADQRKQECPKDHCKEKDPCKENNSSKQKKNYPCKEKDPCDEQDPCHVKNPCEEQNPCKKNSCDEKDPCPANNPCEDKNPCKKKNPCDEQDPCLAKNSCEENNSCEEKNPCKKNNPCDDQDPCPAMNPFEEMDPCKKKNPCDEQDPCRSKDPCEENSPCGEKDHCKEKDPSKEEIKIPELSSVCKVNAARECISKLRELQRQWEQVIAAQGGGGQGDCPKSQGFEGDSKKPAYKGPKRSNLMYLVLTAILAAVVYYTYNENFEPDDLFLEETEEFEKEADDEEET